MKHTVLMAARALSCILWTYAIYLKCINGVEISTNIFPIATVKETPVGSKRLTKNAVMAII